MKNKVQKGGCWPTVQQELLLKAALLSGKEAIQSWEKWIDALDLNKIDYGSQRLLPLLLMNLRSNGISHSLMNEFKERYRRSYFKNQMLFNEMAKIIRAFESEGIKTLILKGAVLATFYYETPACRPMDDFDLLVPSSKIIQAINLLMRLNWKPVKDLENLNDENLIYQRAFHLVSDSGYELDLHRHIFFSDPNESADQNFWNTALPIVIGGARTLTLNPADLLLHTIVHGLTWTNVSSLRWVADSLIIIKKSPSLDWDRLVLQSGMIGTTLTLKEGLFYLANVFHASVPNEILNELKTVSIPYDDYQQFKIFCQSRGLRNIILKHWYTYNRFFSGSTVGLNKLTGFFGFLQHFWKLKSITHVPIVAIKKRKQNRDNW